MELMNVLNILAAIGLVTQFSCLAFRQSVLAHWISIVSFVYCAIWQYKVMDSTFGLILGLTLAFMTFLKVYYVMAPKDEEVTE